jgi:endoglucanase
VSDNHLVDVRGQRVVLHGVDRSASEYACVGTNGSNGWLRRLRRAEGPGVGHRMKTWDINAVRVPLNEACWNGDSYVKKKYCGTSYRKAIEEFVGLLNRNGLVVILDLHWTDGDYPHPGARRGPCARSPCRTAPSRCRSGGRWRPRSRTTTRSSATCSTSRLASRGVNPNSAEAWHCWRYGGHCTGISYSVAGMQTLVDTVRATGAKNVIMLGGLAYSSDLSEWLRYEPTDRDHNLAASWHAYNFGGCHVSSCWNGQVAPVLKKVPLIAGEIGENDCADDYIDPLMTWLDARSASYLAWAWNADFGCGTGPGLITSYNGTPTAFGTGYRAHLLSRR